MLYFVKINYELKLEIIILSTRKTFVTLLFPIIHFPKNIYLYF